MDIETSDAQQRQRISRQSMFLWQTIKINNDFYIFKLSKENEQDVIFRLSNFQNVWQEIISVSDILERVTVRV